MPLTPNVHDCPLCRAIGSTYWAKGQPYPPLTSTWPKPAADHPWHRPVKRHPKASTPETSPRRTRAVPELGAEHPCRRCGAMTTGPKNRRCLDCTESLRDAGERRRGYAFMACDVFINDPRQLDYKLSWASRWS